MSILPVEPLFKHFKVDASWLEVLYDPDIWGNPPRHPIETWRFLAAVVFYNYFPARPPDSDNIQMVRAPGKRFKKSDRKERWFCHADKKWLRKVGYLEWDKHRAGHYSRRYRIPEQVLRQLVSMGIKKYDTNLWTRKLTSKRARFPRQPSLNTITRKPLIKHKPIREAIKILSSKSIPLNVYQLTRLLNRVESLLDRIRNAGKNPPKSWQRVGVDCRKMLYLARQPEGYCPSYNVNNSGRVTDIFCGLQVAHRLVKKAALWGIPYLNFDLSDSHLNFAEILTGSGLLPGIIQARKKCIDYAFDRISKGKTGTKSRKSIKKKIKKAFLATFNAGRINSATKAVLKGVFRWYKRATKHNLHCTFELPLFYAWIQSVIPLHEAVLRHAINQSTLTKNDGRQYTNACGFSITDTEIKKKLTEKAERIIKNFRATKNGKKILIPEGKVNELRAKFVVEAFPAQIVSHYMLGKEADTIHKLTIAAENHGLNPVSNQHDGIILLTNNLQITTLMQNELDKIQPEIQIKPAQF